MSLSQLNLFPLLSASGTIDVRGDVATSKVAVLWTIEQRCGNGWQPMAASTFHSRKEARRYARLYRLQAREVRVVPYKCAFDSKYRPNRQISSMRLDY